MLKRKHASSGISYSILLFVSMFILVAFVCSTDGSPYTNYYASDYVANNASDVDTNADKGSHGNFSAQQAGPDSVFDVLTEENTNSIVFKQVTVSSEQMTTSTVWTDVTGANVSFTPTSAAEEWVIFVTADIRSSSTSEDQARFRYDVNGVPRGETGVQQGTTGVTPIDPYNVYFHFTRITGVTSQQIVKFQFQAFSGAIAYARNIHILCIRLDPAGLQYTEVNGDISITGPQILATLQFTPSSAGNYIVAYCALISELPTGGGAETWLAYASGGSLHPDAWTTPNTKMIHTDRDQFEPHGLFTRMNLIRLQHAFRVETQLENPIEDCTARDVRIAAFRVDAFDLLESHEDIAVSSTTGVNTVRSVVNVLDPVEQRDYLILAGIHTVSSGISSRESGGIEIDDVFVQRKGDQRLSYAQIARIASHYAYVKTTSASFKVETTYGTGGTGFDTVYSKQSVIYVLKIPQNYELDLEVQWTAVDFDESNEILCVYGGTMGAENIRFDVWNGTTWQNLFTALTSGWNNASVSLYLNSSTFTGRFKGSAETVDTSQDTWNIDVALLHTWSGSSQPFHWSTTLLFALPLVVFVPLFVLILRRKQRKETRPDMGKELDSFSGSFGMTHQQMIGQKMLLEIDPTSDFHKSLSSFAAEARRSDELLFILTNKTSTLHSAYAGDPDVKFLLLTSKTSSSQRTGKNETLLPATDLSVLFDAFSRIQKAESKKTINMLFDNISDIILRCGFEKTYKFTRFLLEAISSPKTTALFLFNPTAHDPSVSSSIRGLFQIHLAYTKRGPSAKT